MSVTALDHARQFLDEHWSPSGDSQDWATVMVDNGWSAMRWPVEFCGRGLSDDEARACEALFRERKAPGTGQDRFNLWAGTMVRHGSTELKHAFIRKLLLDEVAMCLLYSEPGAGSDLAGLRTTAIKDGDEWIITGQKVWTSGGRDADYGMLIARTDWDQPKHRGITFFFFPMKQPGVEVRPLRQATGDSRFNEVFITEARVPDSHRLGDLNAGWMVLQTALTYERAVMGISKVSPSGDNAKGATAKAHGIIPKPDLSLVDLAHRVGKANDPVIRQRIAKLHCLKLVNEWTSTRAAAQTKKDGSSPLVSLGKLAMSEILHSAGRLQGHLLGNDGMLDGDQHPASRDANYSQLNAYFTSIGGGTDQIQRNIIGERVLGLPKEPETDRAQPFRDVPANG